MKNDESGSMLLSLIVALGMVLAFTLLAAKVKLNSKLVNDRVYAKSSSEFQLESFTQKVAKFSSDRMSAFCASNVQLGAGFDLNGSESRIAKAIGANFQSTDFLQVAKRCQKPSTSTGGQFYFCLDIERNPDHPANSFLGAEYNFAEVSVRLVDKWQRAVNCSSYMAMAKEDKSLQIYYRFYWVQGGRNQQLNQKSGFYYALQ